MPDSATVHPILKLLSRDPLSDQVQEFLIDREARGLSKRTVAWYGEQLAHVTTFLSIQGVTTLDHLTPSLLRSFLLEFSKSHNPGGTHGVYRALRALCNWYAGETEGLPNPILKVMAPRVPQTPLEPVNLDHLVAMLRTCQRRVVLEERDRAVMLFLLDSGTRRAEFLALDIGDINLKTGAVLVRHGKGDKARTCFIGAKTRRALLAYLRARPQAADADPLWTDERGRRLSPWALRALLVHRAKLAGVPAPSIHSFRRGFALAALRGGCDLISLQRLLGHSSLAIVSRYLKQVDGDLQAAHDQAGIVDKLLGR